MTDTFEEFDFSEVESGVKASDSNVMPSTTRSGTSRPRGRRPVKRLETLQKKLSGEMFQAGTMIGMGLPTTGYFLAQESDEFTKAIVELAAHRVEWIDALEKVADIGPGITIGRVAIGTIAAVGVDRNKIDPNRALLGFLGVYRAYEATHNTEGESPGFAEGYNPPPGTFHPVG